jgi:MFS family permease
MLPLSVFREPGVALGAVIGMLVYSYPAIMVFLTLYLQGILGKPPQTAGLLFIPLAATLTAVAVFAGPITKRFGALPSMAAGMVLISLGTVVFAALPVGGSLTRLVVGEVLLALGIMLAIPAAGAVMMASVPRERAGIGAAAMQAFRQIGAVISVALFGAIAAAQTKAAYTAPSAEADTPAVIQNVVGGEISRVTAAAGTQAGELGAAAWLDGMHVAMLVIAVFSLLGAVLCVVALRRRHRADHSHPAVPH